MRKRCVNKSYGWDLVFGFAFAHGMPVLSQRTQAGLCTWNFTKHEPIVDHTFRRITVKYVCHLDVSWEVGYLISALPNSQIIMLLPNFFFLDF